jgi:pentatricopeptide repeat protein
LLTQQTDSTGSFPPRYLTLPKLFTEVKMSAENGSFSEMLQQYPVLEQVCALLYSARSELLLFFLVFSLHHFLFGTSFPRPRFSNKRSSSQSSSGDRDRQQRVPRGRAEDPGDDPGVAIASGDLNQVLRQSQDAFERSDHRSVLRLWSALRKYDQVPAGHLAQILESMQRFKKDSSMILAEVQGYLRRNRSFCDVVYVNRLLEPLAKSLDTEVVDGVFEYLSTLEVTPDSLTYEILIHMYFTTRSFDQVRTLCKEMGTKKMPPTAKTSLVMLKTALSAGQLDEAIKHYKEVSAAAAASPVASASQAPRHLAVQLAELACREHRLDVVLEQLESGRMPLTADMLNAMLTEALRTKDRQQADRLESLITKGTIEKNGRTFHLLMKMANGDRSRVSRLLDEMAAAGADCTQDVATAVLTVASASKDVVLADKLYAQISSDKTSQIIIPALLALVRFYAENGAAEKACDVYEKHLQSRANLGEEKRRSLMDARTERCLISAAFQCGRQSIASTLVEAAPSDTAKHISLIRTAAGQGDLKEALSIFSALESSGAELTHSLYNTVLDACVECRDLRRAEELMQRMQAANVADAVSYNTLIKAYLRVEGYDKARQLMVKMAQAGSSPNHVTYNELINSLVRSDKESRRAQVWDVVEEMKKAGVRPNRITCSILLKSLKAKSSHQDVTRTMDLTSSMEEPMDEVLLSSVVEACVRIGKPSLLTQKLEELQGRNGVTVTGAHTFGSLIKAYGCAKDIGGAWRCWKEMRSQHIRPTSITIGCMVEAVVSNGDVDGGYELITQLLEDDQCREQVNSVVFGSVLKGYGRTKRMERVWAVFKEMLGKGIEPSIVTFNAVIDACARNGHMHALPELMTEMKARKLEPNLITYSTMIKGFCQRGDMQSALQKLEELRKTTNLRPDEIVFNTLLDGCSSAGLVVEGERLLSEMRAEGITPSNYTLTVMVRLLGHARRLDRALALVEEITTRYRFKTNSHVVSALIQACLTSRDQKRAMAVFDKASQDRVSIDPRIGQTLVRTLLSSGSTVQAVSVLRNLLNLNGGGGQARTNGDRQAGNYATTDDAFVNEALSSMLDRGGEAANLASQLIEDLRVARPRMRIDYSVSNKVAAMSNWGH